MSRSRAIPRGLDGRVPSVVFGGVAALTALGVALRALHLDIPIRYDEAHTFLEYARHGVLHLVSTYEHPNNHVLHTLLVWLSTEVVGDGLVGIRLPAFLAGALLVPAAALLAGARGAGAAAALLAAAFTAGWPVLVEYSVNARGYSLAGLVTVLSAWLALEIRGGRGGWRWWVLGALGVVGHFTVPVMLLPWTAIVLFLAHGTLGVESGPARTRALASVGSLALGVGAVTLLLYLPILLSEGLGALLDDRYVVVSSEEGLARRLPADLGAIALHWARGLSPTVAGLVGAGVAVSVAHRRGRGPLVELFGWCLLVSFAFLLLRGTQGYERVWLWLLPVALAVAAQGWGLLVGELSAAVSARSAGRLRARMSGALLSAGIAALVAVGIGGATLAGDAVRGSLETGGYPEGPEVARFLAGAMGPRDIVLTDFVSVAPLAYYRERLEGVERMAPAGGGPHAWIVLNTSEQQRIDHLTSELEADGLDLSRVPVLETIGATRIHRVRMAGDG
jgi:hypothetical protein